MVKLELVEDKDGTYTIRFAGQSYANHVVVNAWNVKDLKEIFALISSEVNDKYRLQAALAYSKDPCMYCALPYEETSKCNGFPMSCGRMDDKTLCPELGMSLDYLEKIQELEKKLDSATKQLESLYFEDVSD